MKNSLYKLILICFLSFACTDFVIAQENSDYNFEYKVSKVLPPLSIPRAQLKEARTLIDLNRYYKSSWIRSYHSVEISAKIEGELKTASGEDNILLPEQIALIEQADLGTDIAVKVKYMPENNLVKNDLKEMNFSFTIDPEIEASYSGGPQQLDQYLATKGLDKIPNTAIQQYNLAAVKFVVNEKGQIIDAEIKETSKDEQVDQLLLKTICDMPDWTPATYADGSKVRQEFVLTVGDHTSCVVNLLNIRRLEAE